MAPFLSPPLLCSRSHCMLLQPLSLQKTFPLHIYEAHASETKKDTQKNHRNFTERHHRKPLMKNLLYPLSSHTQQTHQKHRRKPLAKNLLHPHQTPHFIYTQKPAVTPRQELSSPFPSHPQILSALTQKSLQKTLISSSHIIAHRKHPSPSSYHSTKRSNHHGHFLTQGAQLPVIFNPRPLHFIT